MVFRLAILALACSLASAAEWTVYRMGPFEVYADRTQSRAKLALNHLEQLRWTFSTFTGKADPKTVFPIRVVVTNKPLSPRLVAVGDGWRGFLPEKEDIPPAWNAQIVRILMDDNLGQMPHEIEAGFIDTLSTVEVSGTHVIIGQPPPKPNLDWARMHMLFTNDSYRGRARVVIANLEKGAAIDVAMKNSLSKSAEEIDREAKAHLDASAVPTFDLPGKPLNASRDFTARVPDEDAMRRVLNDKSGPDTAMGLFEAGKYEEASKIRPEWSAPFREMARRETDPGHKGGLMKKAAELAPRDAALWMEFATMMTEYERWLDADKAWAQAIRASDDAKQREAIQAKRLDLTEKRLAAEEAARREARLAEERELQRLKNETIASIQAAERKANAGGTLDPAVKVHDWWDGPQPDAKVTGKLTRVVCGARFSLTVLSEGQTVTLAVADPKALAITGAGVSSLACGIQKPARDVEVEYIQKTKQAAIVRFQ